MGKKSREKQERGFGNPEPVITENSFKERVLIRLIEWGTYLALFTPTILFVEFYFPYVVPKTIFFRVLVDLMFIAYILLVLCNRRYLPKFNKLGIALLVFVGVIIIASVLGINPVKSFWSVFERMTGILTFLHLTVFFVILTSVFREMKYWKRFIVVSILAGVSLCGYEFFNGNPSTGGGATVGNISFLASYLLFNIFFAIALMFTSRKWYWSLLSALALALMLATLFFSFELPRGGIAAFFIGTGLLVLAYMFFSGKAIFRKAVPIVLILMFLVGGMVLKSDWLKENIIDLSIELPGDARELVWGIGLEGWKERPLLGWGEDNFNIVFTKYFVAEVPPTGDIWYDRVHNIIFDLLISAGLAGLVAYIALFGIAVASLFRVASKMENKRDILLPLAIASALIAYFLQNIWVFDMISSYMIFFFSLALVSFLISAPKEERNVRRQNSPFAITVALILIVVAFLALYFGNVKPALASHYVVMGIASQDVEKSVDYFQKALKESPIAAVEGPEQFSRKMSDFFAEGYPDKASLKTGFELAAVELKKSFERTPDDFRKALVLGKHYADFANLTQNKIYLDEAAKYLQKAIELSPENQQSYWILSQVRIYQGDRDGAVEAVQQAIDLNPDYGKAHWILVNVYTIIGEHELAIEKVKDAEALGFNWKEDIGNFKKVIANYQELGNSEKLTELYLEGITLYPNDPQMLAGAAFAFANTGQFDKARQVANMAMEIDSTYADQLQKLLDDLSKMQTP